MKASFAMQKVIFACGGVCLFLMQAAAHAANPTAPANLTAVAVTPYQTSLIWTKSTASGKATIKGYDVYRNGVRIENVNNPKQTFTTVPLVLSDHSDQALYSDAYLTPGTKYTYTVAAIDSSGEVSAESAPATATTPPAITAPAAATIPPFYSCATNYYVSGTSGSDTAGDGSKEKPWASISKAIAVLTAQGGTHGGVCVNVAPGTYAESVQAGSLSGDADTPTGYFVLRSTVPHAAIIHNPPNRPRDYVNGIEFKDATAKYIVIDGFTLDGSTNRDANNWDGNGIVVLGATTHTCSSHHIKILNNLAYGWGGSGITTGNLDYVDAEANVVYGCAYISQWGESGIDFVVPVAVDSGVWNSATVDAASAKYHYIIRNNIAYFNQEINIHWGPHWDGHGITLDTFNADNNTKKYPPTGYLQQTLVAGNVCFGNGGAGIALGGSGASYVTIRSNTCFDNFLDNQNIVTARGEIEVAATGNCGDVHNVMVNNLCYANPAANPDNVAFVDGGYGKVKNTGETWMNNLAYNGTPGQASVVLYQTTATISTTDGNILGSDPLFNNALVGDFTLRPGSPAINSGTSAYGLDTVDIAGNPRVHNGKVDMGAYALPAESQHR